MQFLHLVLCRSGVLGKLSWALLRVNEVMDQLDSYLEVLEENPLSSLFRCRQNSVPCRCRMEVLISLLAISQGLLFALRSCPHSFSCVSCRLQASKSTSMPSHAWNPLTSSSAYNQEYSTQQGSYSDLMEKGKALQSSKI